VELTAGLTLSGQPIRSIKVEIFDSKVNFMHSWNTDQKPQAVTAAVNMFWASLAIGLVRMLSKISDFRTPTLIAFVSFVFIITFATVAFLLFKASAGRNWARITMLVLFVVGMPPELRHVLGEFSRSALTAALAVAQCGLQAYALFLLFTKPGSTWFRRATYG
jgi:hypothetical protein